MPDNPEYSNGCGGDAWSGLLLVVAMMFACPLLVYPLHSAAESAWPAPLAARSLLLDIVAVDGRFYAVGERGHILESPDGDNWRQQSVPTRVLLTAVDFRDADRGCAVGHDEVIVCTDNGGADWRLTHESQAGEPLLDVLFLSPDRVVAVGAYGLYLESNDAGRSWQRRAFLSETGDDTGEHAPLETDAMNVPAGDYDLHLNAIVRVNDDELMMAAEMGQIYLSADDGHTWRLSPSPYQGSWFGLQPESVDALLAYGLRGRVYRRAATGDWQYLEQSTEQLLTDSHRFTDGSILIVGHGGILLYWQAETGIWHTRQYPGRPAFQAVTSADDGTVHMASDRGVIKQRRDELLMLSAPVAGH